MEQLVESTHLIRGEEISAKGPKYVCSECGCALMSPAQATDGVKNAIAAYQHEHGMLTGEEAASQRRALKLSSEQLARRAKVSIATIKRLEAGGHLVNPSIDTALRSFFERQVATYDTVATIRIPHHGSAWCLADPERWSYRTPALIVGAVSSEPVPEVEPEPEMEVAA